MKHTAHQRHRAKWRGCTQCNLHTLATQKVFASARGTRVQADVCWVGEAPGRTEDLTGKPFTGPSGGVLMAWRHLLHEEFLFMDTVTNLVLCRSCTPDRQRNVTPVENQILACRPRLQEFFKLTGCWVVVELGWLSQVYTPKSIYVPGGATGKSCVCTRQHYGIKHPAAIIRSGGVGSVEYATELKRLRKIFGRLFNANS